MCLVKENFQREEFSEKIELLLKWPEYESAYRQLTN